MQEARQAFEMVPHVAEDDLELLVIVGAGKPYPLHAQVDRHRLFLHVDAEKSGDVMVVADSTREGVGAGVRVDGDGEPESTAPVKRYAMPTPQASAAGRATPMDAQT
jgi:hypothetical protein